MSLTPLQIEAKLTALVSEITRDQIALASCRDAETDAEVELKRAQVRAFHNPNCPKVTRGGYTVADRDAWIDSQVLAEWEAAKRATTAREIAQDKLRADNSVLDAVRSLAPSVRAAYENAGRVA